MTENSLFFVIRDQDRIHLARASRRD